jgi:hypothetical protein
MTEKQGTTSTFGIILEKTFFLAEPRLVLLEAELVGDADPALFPPLTTAEPYSCHGCRVC